ncbi:hypothetical protein AOQ72_04300 [Bradyrhizobium yuanmingense]|uniref:Uncharacterized protein n=1 Tax=Bradyrhizobium yuanmingense TaxID=108015 RepID=A0A0R3BKF5_9BRAD|nr:hypothetical protein AOQ72_04300 [Bradyrhizobium yuanmingense]
MSFSVAQNSRYRASSLRRIFQMVSLMLRYVWIDPRSVIRRRTMGLDVKRLGRCGEVTVLIAPFEWPNLPLTLWNGLASAELRLPDVREVSLRSRSGDALFRLFAWR